MLDLQNFIEDCRLLRTQSPIVHNITNYVAMNFTANVLLAVGASPIMSSCQEEMEDFANLCDTLAVNTGCIDSSQLQSIRIAAAAMNRLGKPWVLDPVGAGASRFRTSAALELSTVFKPSVLRCNLSEAAFLAEALGIFSCTQSSRGVDAGNCGADIKNLAPELAGKLGCVVCISGREDCVSDGVRVECVVGGHPMMAEVTATGCVHGAVCAAFAAVDKDCFAATCNASYLQKKAGAAAAFKCGGTGSFVPAFIDALNVESGGRDE